MSRKALAGTIALALVALTAGVVAGVNLANRRDSTGKGPVEAERISKANPRIGAGSVDSAPGDRTAAISPTAILANFPGRSFGREILVSVAIAPLTRVAVIASGEEPPSHAWSTIKVPILAALLDKTHGETGLTSAEREQARAAVTESDTTAARELFASLGRVTGGGDSGAAAAVNRQLRLSGDTTTKVNTTDPENGFTSFGQTEWSSVESARFYRALANGCILPRDSTSYALTLMRSVVRSQQWGFGSVGYPRSNAVAIKGGWGPEKNGGYLVRQTGIIGKGPHGYVAAVIATPLSGSVTFSEGTDAVTAAAGWIREHARALLPKGGPTASACR